MKLFSCCKLCNVWELLFAWFIWALTQIWRNKLSKIDLYAQCIYRFTRRNINELLEIKGFKEYPNSTGPGKGLALFIKDDAFQHRCDITEEKMQITLVGSNDLEVITVYRSEQGSTLKLIQHLEDLINPGRAIVICGDFNICYRETRNNRVTKFLNQLGFTQLMKEPTHIRGRTIDHFYFREGTIIQENPIIFRYSPYYSDHDAICATMKKMTCQSITDGN